MEVVRGYVCEVSLVGAPLHLLEDVWVLDVVRHGVVQNVVLLVRKIVRRERLLLPEVLGVSYVPTPACRYPVQLLLVLLFGLLVEGLLFLGGKFGHLMESATLFQLLLLLVLPQLLLVFIVLHLLHEFIAVSVLHLLKFPLPVPIFGDYL